MRERRLRVFAILVGLCFIGFPQPVLAETIFEYEESGTITIFDNTPNVPEAVVEFELTEESWTEIRLSWGDPIYCDIDGYLFGPGGFQIACLCTASNPEIVLFYAEPGDYVLELNWWEGQGDEFPDALIWNVYVRQPPEVEMEIEPGIPGGINSYFRVARSASFAAADEAAFRIDYFTRSIGFFSIAYGLGIFNADDALNVGGLTSQVSSYYTFQEARSLFNSVSYKHYINGIPLEELTHVWEGPVRKYFGPQGKVLGYYKRMECGFFNKGELASLIGLGQHTYRLEEYYGGMLVDVFEGDFWLYEGAPW